VQLVVDLIYTACITACCWSATNPSR